MEEKIFYSGLLILNIYILRLFKFYNFFLRVPTADAYLYFRSVILRIHTTTGRLQ
jgi:hypothetical protein